MNEDDMGGEDFICGTGDVASRQIVVATLNFLKTEISANLAVENPGVASVLHLIESLALETQKPLTKRQVENAMAPARMLVTQATSARPLKLVH